MIEYYVFLKVLRFEEYINTLCMSKYEYEYDENIELSIYHPTPPKVFA